MNEIIELNRRIREESAGKQETEDGTLLSREEGPELWRGYSPELVAEAQAVHATLNRLIPDDFSYSVFFGDEMPSLSLEFEDGAQMGSFQSLEIKEHLSIESQFGAMDWDEQRAIEIEKCQTWDQLKTAASQVPAKVIPTKHLQRQCRDDLKDWIREKRRDHLKAFVLTWREDEEFSDEEFESFEAFEQAIPDILATGYQIIGVVANGKPLPVKRIDYLKATALKMMEEHMPISYARATGKFTTDSIPEEEDDEP